jgi:hypothetical protein
MKRYVLVEVDTEESNTAFDLMGPVSWMASVFDTLRLQIAETKRGWEPGDDLPEHPLQPKVVGEVPASVVNRLLESGQVKKG